jgi:hypothetical protein
VVACGIGVLSGETVCTNDFAGVKIHEISITCDTRVNGEHFIKIPCDGLPHLVTNTVRICNTGDLPLSDITIFAPNLVTLGGACAEVANLRLSLGIGECTNLVLCVDAPVCEVANCSGLAFSNYLQITAYVDLTKTNVCDWIKDSSNRVVRVSCSNSSALKPNAMLKSAVWPPTPVG